MFLCYEAMKDAMLDDVEIETPITKITAKRLDEDNQYPYLAYMSAVGVGFMFLVALNRVLRNKGFYQNRH